jgi:hypothetical protein
MMIEWVPQGACRHRTPELPCRPPRTEARLAKGTRTRMWSHPLRPPGDATTDVVTSGHPRTAVETKCGHTSRPGRFVLEASGLERYP